MYAKHIDLPANATFTSYFVGNGPYATQIGRIYSLGTGAGVRYVLESHDWDSNTNEYLDTGDGYDPIIVNIYQDKAEAENELEQRAREATAPEPLPGERPATDVLADLIDDTVGEYVAVVQHGEDDSVVARLRAPDSKQARQWQEKLTRRFGEAASVARAGCLVRLIMTGTAVHQDAAR